MSYLTTTTDGTGKYVFNFPPDDYRIPGAAYKICEEQRTGWLPHTAVCQTVYLPKKPGHPVKAWNFVNQQVGHWESITQGGGSSSGGGSCSAAHVATNFQARAWPTVVVLINGRALAVRWIAENVPAIVEAWLPGEKGGLAVAEDPFRRHQSQRKTLGDGSPPRRPTAGLLQLQEVQTLLDAEGRRQYVDMEPTPLYPFGHGLSYTKFEYADLQLSAPEIAADGRDRVAVESEERRRSAGQGDRPTLHRRRGEQRFDARQTTPRLCQAGP